MSVACPYALPCEVLPPPSRKDTAPQSAFTPIPPLYTLHQLPSSPFPAPRPENKSPNSRFYEAFLCTQDFSQRFQIARTETDTRVVSCGRCGAGKRVSRARRERRGREAGGGRGRT